MGIELHIRKIYSDEFERSAAVIRRSFATVAEEFGLTAQNSPTNGAFLQPARLLEEHRRGVQMFGLFTPGAGQIGFFALENAGNGVWYLEKLAILPDFRHRGFGENLLDWARKYVADAGGKMISIAIIDENTRLKRWYQQYGFVETGRKRFDHLPFTVCYLQIAPKGSDPNYINNH